MTQAADNRVNLDFGGNSPEVEIEFDNQMTIDRTALITTLLITQSTGGMPDVIAISRQYVGEFLRALTDLCQRHGVIPQLETVEPEKK